MVNREMENCKKDPRYEHAYQLLQHMLRKTMPNEALLLKLYDSHIIPIVQRTLEEYNTTGFMPGKLREHDQNAKRTIQEKAEALAGNTEFQEMQDTLCRFQTVPANMMRKYFGKYSSAIISADELYFDQAIKSNFRKAMRRNNTPTSVHLNGAAFLAREIIPDYTNANTAAVRLHDVPEDLLTKDTLLKQYDSFIEAHIPEELQDTVKKMTNKYHLLLKFCYGQIKDDGFAFNRENLLATLYNLHSPCTLDKSVENIITALENNSINDTITPSDDFFAATKWFFYDKYLEDMANECNREGIYIPYENKGFDLWHNRNDTDDVDGIDRIKNIIKRMDWVNKGYKLGTRNQRLNDHIAEHGETALNDAEYVTAKVLLEKDAPMTRLNSVKKKIEFLQPVFYINKKLVTI